MAFLPGFRTQPLSEERSDSGKIDADHVGRDPHQSPAGGGVFSGSEQ